MKNSLKKQIRNNFALIISAILIGGAVVIYGMYNIYSINIIQNELSKASRDTLDSANAHIKWVDSLNISINSGTEFKGSLDPTTCSFGV